MEEFGYDREMKYLILIIYDISDNKRRYNLSKHLEKYGTRVQRSSFEARLNKRQLNRMIDGIESIIKKDDNIRIYKLYGYDEVKIYGDKDYEKVEDVYII